MTAGKSTRRAIVATKGASEPGRRDCAFAVFAARIDRPEPAGGKVLAKRIAADSLPQRRLAVVTFKLANVLGMQDLIS
jgi:hypothetical protein